MNKYKDNKYRRLAFFLTIMLSITVFLSACDLFTPSKISETEKKANEAGTGKESSAGSSEAEPEVAGTVESTLDKTKLPPEPMIVVDPKTGESKELEMPSFANLAEQESYVKAMNEQFMEVDLGETSATSTETTQEVKVYETSQAEAENTIKEENKRNQAKVSEIIEDKGAYLIFRDAELAKFIILPLNEAQDKELQEILAGCENEAIKSKEEGGAKSSLALSNGSLIRFDASNLYPEWKEEQDFIFSSKEGEVFGLKGSHALPRRLFEILSFNQQSFLINDFENPANHMEITEETAINAYVQGQPSKTELSLVLENKGTEDYAYSPSFRLDILQGEEFVGLGKDRKMLVLGVMEPRLIKAGERIEIKQEWGDIVGELPRGLYRIQLKISPFENKNNMNARDCELYFFLP